MSIKKIGLFFDRSYIDAHACFYELINHLTSNEYEIDLFYIQSAYNPAPFFQSGNVRCIPFPLSILQKAEYQFKRFFSDEYSYSAVFGTPVAGSWLAYKYSRWKNVPYFYLADEVFDPELKHFKIRNWDKFKKQDKICNKAASATIALSEKRYSYQQQVNSLDSNHPYFILPNSQSGDSIRMKSSFFRDICNIDNNKPIVLFFGSFDWKLFQKFFSSIPADALESYNFVIHSRKIEELAATKTGIYFSNTILPSQLINYALSSADIGIALYDNQNLAEKRNSLTAGKISSYLKCQLPILAGDATEMMEIQSNNLGKFWSAGMNLTVLLNEIYENMDLYRKNIPEYYSKNLDYSKYFSKFNEYLKNAV